MSEVEASPWMEGWQPALQQDATQPRPPGNPGWKKGMSSPNPKGRPVGCTPQSKLVQRMLEDADGIVDALIAKALDGDSNAASLVLSRILPSIKAQSEKVAFDFNHTAPISQQVEQVLAAIADARLAPDVGKQIIDAIGNLSSIRATEELEARIAVLEEARDARG